MEYNFPLGTIFWSIFPVGQGPKKIAFLIYSGFISFSIEQIKLHADSENFFISEKSTGKKKKRRHMNKALGKMISLLLRNIGSRNV